MRQNLAQIIEEKNLNVKKLAAAVNISQPFMTQIIKGYKTPSLEVALRISKHLETKVEYLFNDLSESEASTPCEDSSSDTPAR